MFRSVGKIARLLPRSVPGPGLDAKQIPATLRQPPGQKAGHGSRLTFTAHPTLHADHLSEFGEHLAQQGLKPQTFLQAQQLFRAYLAERTDPAQPPSPQDEWKLQLSCLGLLMDHVHTEASAGRALWSDFERPFTWIARDHDGTHIPPGSLLTQRCDEICFVCDKYLAVMEAEDAPAFDNARMLVQYTQDLATELGGLRSSGLSPSEIRTRSAHLLEELDIESLEDRLTRLVPPGPVSDLVKKFGLGGFEGEARINSDHLGKEKMHQVLDEIHAAKGLRAVRSIVIADCGSLKQFNVLRGALDDRGLRDVEVVPLLESREAMEAHFAGEFRVTPARGEHSVGPRKIMVAGSDNPRVTGIALSILYAERAEIENAEGGIESYRGTGWGPERSGGGSSAAAWSLVRGKDLDGRQWRAPQQLTVQGPPTLLLLTPGASQEFAGSFLSPVHPEFHLTRQDIALVQRVLDPVVQAELQNRASDSPFAKAYKQSRLGQVAIPFAGSRDAFTKVKDGKEANQKGPYENRAIKVNAQLFMACVHFGVAFASMGAKNLQEMVDSVNAIKAADDPGPKYLMDKIMYNLGMQAARLHDPVQLAAVWQACGFDDAAVDALSASAGCVVKLLAKTGYSIDSNEPLQQMVAQDWGVAHIPGDRQGNMQRIKDQASELHRATMKFLSGEGSFSQVEAAGPGPGRRSFSTLRGA